MNCSVKIGYVLNISSAVGAETAKAEVMHWNSVFSASSVSNQISHICTNIRSQFATGNIKRIPHKTSVCISSPYLFLYIYIYICSPPITSIKKSAAQSTNVLYS
jgi:hypothetical protein